MKTITTLQFTSIIVAVTLTAIISCSKGSENGGMGDGTVATVQVSLSHAEFEGEADLNRAATPYLREPILPKAHYSTLEIGDDMLLVAEIAAEDPALVREERKQNRVLKDSKAAIETGNLGDGIRYRVLVFNANGTFNRQQEYIRGSEASAPAMLLDGGSTYTFVVYSVNSTAATTAPTFSGAQTLANANLSITGSQDFMYFRQDLTLVGGPNPNRLNIVLKHRFSQVTTIIDASATGYNPQNITASFGPHSNIAEITLSNGNVTRGTSTARSSVTANLNNGTPTSSYSTIINAAANNTTNYQIASLQIGNLTLSNLTPFTALPITPGVKYNLVLRVTPNDQYLQQSGQSAARINGQVWMRYNLGATTSIDPDQNPSVQALHGNYYQWGRINSIANASTPTGAISGWNTDLTISGNAWNNGNQTVPAKSAADPCPSGFRVPTYPEMQSLLNATNSSFVGVWSGSATNFSVARVLQSRRNANIRLTLPIAGARSFNNGALTDRGVVGFYWSSYKITTTSAYRYGFRENSDDFDQSVVSWASSVRCIAQ